MSGKVKEINFNNLFSVFKNYENDQFSLVQDLIKVKGIHLRFFISKESNPVNGLFGKIYADENYDYHGVHHLLNCSRLFRGINNYCNQNDTSGMPLKTLNKIFISQYSSISLSIPQIDYKKQMKIFDLTYEDKCPLNNKDLVYKILKDGYLDLVIKLEISDDEHQTKKEFIQNQDQYECFKSIIELKMFAIQNKIKKNKELIKYLFTATDEELNKISYEKSEDKVNFFYKRYNQEFDLLWFFCFLDNLESDNGDIKDYLKNVNFLYSSYLKDGEAFLFKLENNKIFEVFKND